MIAIKTPSEIEIMREGGRRLSLIMAQLLKKASPGVRLVEIEELAQALLNDQGLKASFSKVPGYKWATCINVNNGIVHGIPGNYQIREGDLVSIDMGIIFKGYHADMARTVLAGPRAEKDKNKQNFLLAGKKALAKATKVLKPGNRFGQVSKTIEETLISWGFSPIKSFVGHGIGKKLHEEPQIPCFLRDSIEKTPLIKPGMVVCIEVIYGQKDSKVQISDDGWTAFLKDGSLAGLFEDMVAVGLKKPLVLTRL